MLVIALRHIPVSLCSPKHWADYVLRGQGGEFALRICAGEGQDLRGICAGFALFARDLRSVYTLITSQYISKLDDHGTVT